MFDEFLFFFRYLKIGISYKVKIERIDLFSIRSNAVLLFCCDWVIDV